MCHGWRCLGAIEKEEKVQKSNGNYSINQLFSYFAIKIKEDITALMTKFGREKSSSLSRQETGALPPSLSSQHDTTSSQKCCCAFGEPKPRFFSLRIPPMKKGFRWKEGRRGGGGVVRFSISGNRG